MKGHSRPDRPLAAALKKACGYIRRARRIVISGHVNPDGDAIGSMLALGAGLARLGKRPRFLCQGDVPLQYRDLPGARRIVRSIAGPFDLAIAVDCSAPELLGDHAAVFERAGAVIVLDHHEYRRPFGDCAIIDHRAAAVGELVYLLLRALGVRMTRPIGANILTSIIVETNLFKISTIRPLTFTVCAEALASGVDFARLSAEVYGRRKRETALLAAAVMLRARTLNRGRVIWSLLRKTDLARSGGQEYDADPIAEEMRSIDGVRAAVLFRESDRRTLRVSLRSNAGIDVGAVAHRYGGGGHADIAGCYLPHDPEAMEDLLRAVSRAVGR